MTRDDLSKVSGKPILYGTFPPVYPPPSPAQPSIGPPLPPFYHNTPTYHAIPVGYQSYGPVVEGIPLREPRLPCCGIGIGWFLFLAGFFFAAVPWYIGAFILLFVGVEYREKAGLIACTVGAVLVAITVILGLSHENVDW